MEAAETGQEPKVKSSNDEKAKDAETEQAKKDKKLSEIDLETFFGNVTYWGSAPKEFYHQLDVHVPAAAAMRIREGPPRTRQYPNRWNPGPRGG